jgi:hypothetical protein
MPMDSPEAPLIRLTARLVTLVCVLFGVGLALHSFANWEPADVSAYWDAAERMRAGQPLYAPAADINAADVYRYAPWFAAAWIPLTLLPRDVVELAWSCVLVAASLAVAVPLMTIGTRAGVASGAILGAFLIQIASRGNVHPLMIAALAFGVERRTGPLWIAMAASLKATPILFVIVYATRRQWGRVAVTLVLTAVLVLPMLAAGVEGYTTNPGWSLSLFVVSPILFGIVGAIAVLAAVYVSVTRPRLAWLSVSIAVVMTLPRYFTYEATFFAVGAIPATPAWKDRPEGQGE